MAKSPWLVQVDATEEPLTPRRRTRGSAADSVAPVSLRRDSDGATIGVGDVVKVERPPASPLNRGNFYFAVVVDISMGVASKPVVTGLPFVPGSAKAKVESESETDSEEEEKEQEEEAKEESKEEAKEESREEISEYELLLLPVAERIKMDCVDEKTTVYSKSNWTSGYFCCHAVAKSGRTLSAEFDYAEWTQLLRRNSNDAVSFLAESTLPAGKRKQRRIRAEPLSERLEKAQSPRPKRTQKWDSDSESDALSESESESESELSEEERPKRGRPRKSPAKANTPKSTPRKPKSISTDSNFNLTSPTKSPKKRSREAAKGTDVFQKTVNILSPLNKGFKVKTGSVAASLPSLSRDPSSSPTKRTHAEAFRQLREKLHTSTRISSLPGREEQFGDVYVALESAVSEKTGCCIYVSGTPGTGKTATVREAIGSLRDNAIEGYVEDFDFLEINCLKLLAPSSAYEQLWEHLSGFKVTPANAALLLEEHFSNHQQRKPLILLMDELDQLVTKSQDVVYNFFNWPTYPQSRLIVVAVANTMDLPERALSNKIASRLGLRRFAFRGYTEEELGTIIEHRLTMLSEENRRKVEVSPDAMRFASKKVALVSGDARRALTICRRAVEIAELEYLAENNTQGVPEQEQSYSVQTKHVGLAIAEAVNSPMASSLENLPFASKLVLASVLLRMRRTGLGENPLGDVLDEMKNSLRLLTTNHSTSALDAVAENASYLNLLYGSVESKSLGIRIHHLAYIVDELEEQGILLQQNVRSDRHRLVGLNITEDEVATALKKDQDIGAML